MQYVHKFEREDRLWCVGYWKETKTSGATIMDFHTIRDCASMDEAAAFINYLNGGNGKVFAWDSTAYDTDRS